MRIFVYFIVLLLAIPSISHAARGGSWGGDIKVGGYSVDGHSSLGLNFDSNADGINEVTMDALGLFTPGNVTSDPCTSAANGSIFWNSTAKELCVCDGTNDVRVKDASTACF